MDEKTEKTKSINFSMTEYSILSDDPEIMVIDAYLGYQDVLSSHGTVFTNNALINAQKTLCNKPLIGIWDIALNDFKEHSRNIYDLKNTCILGSVPETNDFQIVEFQGKMFQKCLVVIWKQYINPDILEKMKTKQNIELSIEIYVNDYTQRDDGYFQINDFRYDAICLLGANERPAMPGSHIEVIKFSEHKDKYNEQYNKIYFSLQNKEEKQSMEKKDKKSMDDTEKKDPNVNEDETNEPEGNNACGDDMMKKNTSKSSKNISYSEIIKELTTENINLKGEIQKYSDKIKKLESKIEDYKKVEYSSQIDKLYAEYKDILEKKDIEKLDEIKLKFSDFDKFHLEFSKVVLEKIKLFDFNIVKQNNSEEAKRKLGKFSNVATIPVTENKTEDDSKSLYELASNVY